MTTTASRFDGRYHGVVISNIDPFQKGRLFVSVSDVLGPIPAFWAEPSTGLAGIASGLYTVALPGSGVWVEFVDGDPDYPVWTGFWRGNASEMPAEGHLAPPGVPVIAVGTPAQNVISLNDTMVPVTGGITLRSGASYINITPAGIEIFAPTVRINGVLNVNFGALTVT